MQPTLLEFFRDFIHYYITHNIVLLLVCVGMLVLLATSPMIGKKNVTPFRVVICLLIGLSLVDDVEHVLEGYREITSMCPVQTARMIFSALSYSMKPAIPFAIFLIISNKKHKRYKTYWIPLALTGILYFTNLFLPKEYSLFYYNECNEFISNPPLGGLRFFNLLTAIFYIVCIFVSMTRTFRHRTFGECFLVAFIAVASIGGYTLESIFSIFDLGNQATSASIMFFFLFLLIKYTNVDPLTNLYNRQYYFSMTNTRGVTGIISIDMNGLKAINDKYGHEKGDEALIIIADKLLTIMNRKVRVFRMGGDEFVVMCSYLDEEQVLSLVHLIDRMVNVNTEYQIAIGYATKNTCESREVLLFRADAMMYEKKKAMKSETK